MNLRLRRFIVILLSLIYVSVTVVAQEKPVPERPASKSANAELRTLRKQQLRILHDNLLSRALDTIKKMDEVALRLSARNQVLAYLSESKTVSDNNLRLKRSLALDAISDLSNNHQEIPQFMLDYLSADLTALIEKHQPDLTEKLQAAKETAKSSNQAVNIRSLFELKNGDLLAAARIRQLLAQEEDSKELHFWLDNLRKQKSREFEPLLREVIAIAERSPQISFETLLWVSPIYFHPDVPRSLQKNFAAMILSRTQPVNFSVTGPPILAYELLTGALPHIQNLLPDNYERAVSQSLVLRTTIDRTQLAGEERSKRLKESQSPIEDLVQEAETAKTKSERNELLAEAAELALQKKKFNTCLDIVAKLDLEITVLDQVRFWQGWKNQFLKKVVKSAMVARELESAERAALGMTASLAKVQAIASIVRYSSETGEKGAAHKLLVEAFKVSESISDVFEKAKSFILLSIICDEVDESKKAQLLISAVKVLNDLNKPTTRRDQEPYQEYLRNLDSTGYQIIRGFKALTVSDPDVGIALADQLHKPDLRPFALIGILTGLNDLLAKND
jgi:hypothetical protein